MYKIYYEDGETFDVFQMRLVNRKNTMDEVTSVISDHSASDLPGPRGVVAILQLIDDRWEAINGKEYYYWNSERWEGTDLWHILAFFEEDHGIIRYKVNQIQVKDKRGRWRETDMPGLFAFLMDTGLVLLGSSLPSETTGDILKQVLDDSKGAPIDLKLPPGTRIKSRRERNEKGRRLQTLW